MRLKVTPKAALEKIDALVKSGWNILYDEAGPLPDSGPDGELEWNFGSEAAESWLGSVQIELRKIFQDSTPYIAFMIAGGDTVPDLKSKTPEQNKMIYNRNLKAGLHVLIRLYDELAALSRSPLNYLPASQTLCFYDLVCPLKKDTNEHLLCEYMFRHSIGEKVEMEDIFVEALHGLADEYCGADRAKIDNACEGINRKTQKAFGFPILAKEKTVLSLRLPARVAAAIG